ncbi:MAG: DUF4942 domain-containing protein [Anaerolineales bacterium]|nr:MAG: DUF4942 domain-containing protein [Anaerolineales bacterium]
MSYHERDLIAPATLAQMVDAYERACRVVREAYPALGEAQKYMNTTFGEGVDDFRLVGDERLTRRGQRPISWRSQRPNEYADAVIDEIRRKVWRKIIDRVGARKMMSLHRIEQMERQLESGEVQEITVPNVLDFLATLGSSAGEIQKEVIRSAFELLMPPKWGELKTDAKNRHFGVQRKVVLHGAVSASWDKARVTVGYGYWAEKISEIDKAFHLLDGKGLPEGYVSPLVDAINQAREGSTLFFGFKTFLNGNLHLEILRDDLREDMNRICGEGVLSKERG